MKYGVVPTIVAANEALWLGSTLQLPFAWLEMIINMFDILSRLLEDETNSEGYRTYVFLDKVFTVYLKNRVRTLETVAAMNKLRVQTCEMKIWVSPHERFRTVLLVGFMRQH